MKTLIFAIALSVLAPSWASANAMTDRCREVSDMAYEIMWDRQTGRAMSDMISEVPKRPVAYRDLADAMVRRVFELRRQSSESLQKFDAELFRDATFSACYKR